MPQDIIIREIILIPQQIAEALKISVESVTKEFQDGRVISRFAEYWAAELFGFHKHNGSNIPLTDGELTTPQMGSIKVSVRTLTKRGIKFQQSKFIGYGRSCNKENLIKSIEEVDKFCVVDITNFPKITLVLLDTKVLLRWIREEKLSQVGLNKVKFYTLLLEEIGVTNA